MHFLFHWKILSFLFRRGNSFRGNFQQNRRGNFRSGAINRGVGGRVRRGRGGREAPPSKDQLDKELDSYIVEKVCCIIFIFLSFFLLMFLKLFFFLFVIEPYLGGFFSSFFRLNYNLWHHWHLL